MSVGYLSHSRYLNHRQSGHPERPERLKAILDALQASDLIDGLVSLSPVPADRSLLTSVHDANYLDRLRTAAMAGDRLLDPDTYLDPDSFDVAVLAAGGAVACVDAVLSDQVTKAFALVRPPGHHALRARAMGFCLLNNVAIAARHALDAGGLDRILIVDFDVHHGNGTQELFYHTDRVLYFSTHQYPWYPGTGNWAETGVDGGRGFTVNAPLPAGTGDTGYERAFREILFPLADRYRPQLVLVSAGYDAHWADPLASMRLTTSGFAALTALLVDLAQRHTGGRMVLLLEGGYHLEALASSILATLSVLTGREPEDPLGPPPTADEPSLDHLIVPLRRTHGL